MLQVVGVVRELLDGANRCAVVALAQCRLRFGFEVLHDAGDPEGLLHVEFVELHVVEQVFVEVLVDLARAERGVAQQHLGACALAVAAVHVVDQVDALGRAQHADQRDGGRR